MPKPNKPKRKSAVFPEAAGKKPNWVRNVTIGIAALGVVSFVAWNQISSHYERKWSDIYKLYDSNLTPSDNRAVIEFEGSMDKISRVRRLYSLSTEFDVDTNGDDSRFLKFLKEHQDEIAGLADVDTEYGGYLIRNGESFRIGKYTHASRNEIIPFAKEVLSGDFTHAEDLKSRIHEYSQSLELDKETEDIAVLAVDYFKSGSFNKELDGAYRKILGGVSGLVQYQTPHFPEDTMKPEFFAGWHIHPRNIPYKPKSPDPDVANTFIIGPEVIFQRIGNELIVYGINRGEAMEMHRTTIN